MLTKVPFYHGVTRKLVIAFGGLFGSIYTVTKNHDGVSEKIVKVPLSFASKEKFILRLQQDPGLNQDVEVVLPRMSFEITGYDYDPSRQFNKVNKVVGSQGNRDVKMFAPVPYNISFTLYSFTRTMEDNLQIMEQILPYFSPEMNLSIKMMADPTIIQDVPLILNDVNMDDQYDGGFEDRRYIISTYTFTMKANYYGPVLGSFDEENHFENGSGVSVIKKVESTINTNLKYTAAIDPFTANKDDTYNIDENWTFIP